MYTPEHPNYIKVKEVLKWHNTHYRSVMVPNDPLIQDILKKLFIDPIDIREYERKNMDYQDFHKTVKEVSDEELSQILIHANEEHRKRQKERYDKLTQEQLDETTRLKEKSMDMYTDYSETEKPSIDKIEQFSNFVNQGGDFGMDEDQKAMDECHQKSSRESVKEYEGEKMTPHRQRTMPGLGEK